MLQIVPASNPNALKDLDNIFSDDEPQLIKKKKCIVRSLGEITNDITNICKSLKEINLKYEFSEINFIPENEETPELRKFMIEFEKSHDSALFRTLDCSKYSQNIKLQISLLQSNLDSNATFIEVPPKIDSRISSLIHWQISTYTFKGEKCYHLLHSLIEYVKTPEPAPISVFFLEFNISNLIYQFCHSLVSLFGDSPFLYPVLESLSPFSNDPNSILSLITEEAAKTGINSGNNLDEDSDSFNDLKPMSKASTPLIIDANPISFTNPLENISDNMANMIKIPEEGPSPVTFRVFRSRTKYTSEEFHKWLTKHHCSPKSIFNYSSNTIDKNVSVEKYAKTNALPKNKNLNSSSKNKVMDYLIESLLTMVFDVDVRSLIPSKYPSVYFSAILPIIHQINCTTSQFFFSSSVAKKVIENEYNAHVGCITKDQKKIDSSMNFFKGDIKPDMNTLQVSPLNERRQFPSADTEMTDDFIRFMKIIDYSLIIAGYSPISLLPSSLPSQSSEYSRSYLAQSIYYIYTHESFPPYISFRASFTIGVLISDKDPFLACNFMYEAILLLLHFYPQLNHSTFVQSAFFEMGCLFNTTNRYYFCCMSMDNAITVCQNNHSLAGKAASIALKNLDAVRAVFYYLTAIKLFIASHQKEELLYTAQLVVSIYVEHDLINEAIQLTSYILKVHDKLDSINSVNTAAILCRLYCSKCHFEDALNIANSIDTNNPTISKIALKLKAKIFISQNKFREFYEIIKPNLTLPNNVLPALTVTKEILLPTIKALARAYVSKVDFISALFWSEIGCHISSHISAYKETPNFFLLRGYILYFIYYKMFDFSVHFMNSCLDQIALNFGKFLNENSISKTEILKEALSSLTIAINLYERGGNVAKLLYSKSIYLQLICSHFLLYRKAKVSNESFMTLFPISKDDMPLFVKKPIFYTSCKVANLNTKTSDIEKIEIKSADQFTQTVKSLQSIANSYYDPFYISFVQSISSVLFYLQNDINSAKITFDLALENIRKFFFKGTRFIVSNCKIWITNRMVYYTRFLLSFLMEFPSDFIKDRLYLFDMMNDISLLLNYQKNTTLLHVESKNEPKIDFTASICNALDDSFWPKFSEFPETTERTKVLINQKMFSLYEQIYKNETNLSDEQIQTTNKKLITKIIGLKKKQVVPEFEIPNNSIYVFMGNSEIISFIPSLLNKRFIPIRLIKKPFFIEGVVNMIDWNIEIIPFSNDFMKSCLLIGKVLFGELDFFKQFYIQNCESNAKSPFDIKPPNSALVVISDHLTQFLPFEFFFPTISLIRRLSSKERENHTNIFRPIIFRNENKADFIKYRRAKLIEFFTTELPTPISVIDNELNLVFPFPLFNPNRTTARYLLLYSFFDVIPIYSNNLPNLTNMKNPLYILTFSDLVSMPDFLFQLIDNNSKACFIFVPASHVSVALFEIKKVFEEFMILSSQKNKNGANQSNYKNVSLFTEKYTYMTILQMTLMKKLKIPVAIIAPNAL